MGYSIRYTASAREDLRRLFALLVVCDAPSARRARDALARGMEFLQHSPFSCPALAAEQPGLHVLLIGFDASAYLALFEIDEVVTILAIRQQSGLWFNC